MLLFGGIYRITVESTVLKYLNYTNIPDLKVLHEWKHSQELLIKTCKWLIIKIKLLESSDLKKIVKSFTAIKSNIELGVRRKILTWSSILPE